MSFELRPEQLAGERWFGGKSRSLEGIELLDALPVGAAGALLLVEARFAEGEGERYVYPAVRAGEELREPVPGEGFWSDLLALVRDGGDIGRFALRPDEALDELLPVGPIAERAIDADQSNTSVVLAERILVKCYRRLEPGPNPDVELTAFLSDGPRFAHTPAYAGAIDYLGEGAGQLALFQAFVPGALDGLSWAAVLLARPDLERNAAPFAEVGAVTAELHAALAGLDARAGTVADLAAWRTAAEARLPRALAALPPWAAAVVEPLEEAIRAELDALRAATPPLLTRIHGDYHLGQVLRTTAGFAVIDFEGEPTKPLAERRALESPLRDVASMLRSIDHVAAWRVRKGGDPAHLADWAGLARARFLESYRAALPVDDVLLRAFEVEKELYEFEYAAAYLPEWLYASVCGMRMLLGVPLARAYPNR